MSLPIREIDRAQRPRERLLSHGAEALSDAELVAILLGSGRAGESAVAVAHGLLRAHGGVTGLSRAFPEELAGAPGVGPAKAARLSAVPSLQCRR